jgi:hypothetical protein
MSDLYTKAVLTIIAICLVVIAFRAQPISEALAQSGKVHVVVDEVDTFAFQFTQPLKVKIER